jgi:hypothetical protein
VERVAAQANAHGFQRYHFTRADVAEIDFVAQ